MKELPTCSSGVFPENYATYNAPYAYGDSAASHASAIFAAHRTRQVTVESTQLAGETSPQLDKSDSSRLARKKNYDRIMASIKRSKERQITKKLENILFGQFGITICTYDTKKSKLMLMEVTLNLIEQIREHAETFQSNYDLDFFLANHEKLKRSIAGDDLSPDQLKWRKQRRVLNKLKRTLDVNETRENAYCQTLSVACDFLNDYLKQTVAPTTEASDNTAYLTNPTQTVAPQSLSQKSTPVTVLPEEQLTSLPKGQLTSEEQCAFDRLKNALRHYSIPSIGSANYGELLFAAAYCIKMNNSMTPILRLGYKQHYLNNFQKADPDKTPRDGFEAYLNDLEKTLLDESFDLVIDKCLTDQGSTLSSLFVPLENSCLNVENMPSDRARALEMVGFLDLAVQYLEEEEHVERQKALVYEKQVNFGPKAKKSRH